jgi:hypothetical protein
VSSIYPKWTKERLKLGQEVIYIENGLHGPMALGFSGVITIPGDLWSRQSRERFTIADCP